MLIDEMKVSLEEISKIPKEEKTKIINLLLGVSFLSSNPQKFSELIFSGKNFEDVYSNFKDYVLKDENLMEKDLILRRLSDSKDILKKLYKYHSVKVKLLKCF